MKILLALLSVWVIMLADASAAPLQSELAEYNSYMNEDTKDEPLEGQLQHMRFFPADEWSPGLTTPITLHAKRAGQPEYVGGGQQAEVRSPGGSGQEETTTTTPMPAAARNNDDDDKSQQEDDEEEVEDEEETGADDDDKDEEDDKRSAGEAALGDTPASTETTPQVPGGLQLPATTGSTGDDAANTTYRQKLLDAVDPTADEDLLELMVRIAESPEKWRHIHNTLLALDQDLAASRNAVVELDGLKKVVKKSDYDTYGARRGESSWDQVWAQQQGARDVGVSDSDRRRAELERAGLLPATKPKQKVYAKPGENSLGEGQRERFGGSRWPPGDARQKGNSGKAWPGGTENKPRQGTGYLAAKSKGKHKGSDVGPTDINHGMKSGKNRMLPSKPYSHPKSAVDYEDTRRHGKVVLMKQDTSPRGPPRRYSEDARHGRLVYQQGDNISDNWSEMVNNRNMDMGRTADRWQHNLKTLRQHEWLRPSEHPANAKPLDAVHRAMAKMPVVAKSVWPRPQGGAYASYARWPDLSAGSVVDTWPGGGKQWPTFPVADDDDDDEGIPPGSKWPKQPGVDTQLAMNAWPGPKPARQWPQFAYHRVTSSPRQRSAFIAVSVVNPPAGRNRSGEVGSLLGPGRGKAGAMLDPLEEQLMQLTARLATPWSHVRHLNNIKEQMKTMSKMKEKLWRHWLERQKILRESSLGFQRSPRDTAPTTSRPSNRQ